MVIIYRFSGVGRTRWKKRTEPGRSHSAKRFVHEMSSEVGSHGGGEESVEEGTKEGADPGRQRSHSRSLSRR